MKLEEVELVVTALKDAYTELENRGFSVMGVSARVGDAQDSVDVRINYDGDVTVQPQKSPR